MLPAAMLEPPFPATDPPQEVRRRDFGAFSPKSHEEWLVRLLDSLAVRGVTVVWYQCRPTWALPERRIPDDMFLYVVRGQLTIRVAGRATIVPRGAGAHFRRGVWHSATVPPSQQTELIALHYDATVFESLTLPVLLNFPDVFAWGGDPVIEATLTEACRLFYRRPAGYRRELEAITVRLLLRVIHASGDWLRPPAAATRFGDVRRLLPALESLRHDVAAPAAIHELARRCGFSESQFRRVFRRTMGVLPVQYQRQLRMERACELLRQTDATVAAVAAAVGYAETAFFAHSFKQLIGVSPGRYRAHSGI